MSFKIKAEPREVLKKKVKSLRNAGYVPAGIYGFNGNHNIQLNEAEFSKLFKSAGHTSVVEVDLDGKNHNVLIDEVQINPVTRITTHVTLREVNVKVEISAEIPFELTNEDISPAVKEQSSLVILSVPAVLLRGLPKNLPSSIVIDASQINAGDTILLKDIKLPEGIELVHEDQLELTIVTTASAIQEEVELNVNEAIAEASAAADAEKVEEEEKTEEK